MNEEIQEVKSEQVQEVKAEFEWTVENFCNRFAKMYGCESDDCFIDTKYMRIVHWSGLHCYFEKLRKPDSEGWRLRPAVYEAFHNYLASLSPEETAIRKSRFTAMVEAQVFLQQFASWKTEKQGNNTEYVEPPIPQALKDKKLQADQAWMAWVEWHNKIDLTFYPDDNYVFQLEEHAIEGEDGRSRICFDLYCSANRDLD